MELFSDCLLNFCKAFHDNCNRSCAASKIFKIRLVRVNALQEPCVDCPSQLECRIEGDNRLVTTCLKNGFDFINSIIV